MNQRGDKLKILKSSKLWRKKNIIVDSKYGAECYDRFVESCERYGWLLPCECSIEANIMKWRRARAENNLNEPEIGL